MTGNICDHEYVSCGRRMSKGENILGWKVTAEIEDFVCKKCLSIFSKIRKPDPLMFFSQYKMVCQR